MPSLGVSTCTWFHLDDAPKRKEAILVAVHLCGGIMSMPGRLDRYGRPVAIGCREPALAWAYYPKPSFSRVHPPNREVEPPSGGRV